MGELEGKVAFLTGAGSGVGVGIALALAKAGASIGLMGRTQRNARANPCQAQCAGREVAGLCWGLHNPRRREPRGGGDRKGIRSDLGAGDQCLSGLATQVEDITDEILDISLRGCIHNTLYCMQAVFPTMKERGGRIVNFGSGGSTQGLPDLRAYNIAKEGIRGLTKTAAMGWASMASR